MLSAEKKNEAGWMGQRVVREGSCHFMYDKRGIWGAVMGFGEQAVRLPGWGVAWAEGEVRRPVCSKNGEEARVAGRQGARESVVKDEVREKAEAGGEWVLLVFRAEGKPLKDLDRKMMGPDLCFNQKVPAAIRE